MYWRGGVFVEVGPGDDQRQLFFPTVLPHGEILPAGVRCLINNSTFALADIDVSY